MSSCVLSADCITPCLHRHQSLAAGSKHATVRKSIAPPLTKPVENRPHASKQTRQRTSPLNQTPFDRYGTHSNRPTHAVPVLQGSPSLNVIGSVLCPLEIGGTKTTAVPACETAIMRQCVKNEEPGVIKLRANVRAKAHDYVSHAPVFRKEVFGACLKHESKVSCGLHHLRE